VSDENDLALAVREVIEPGGDRHRGMRRLITEVARRAGSSRAGGTGRWLAELVMDVAVPIPIRDLATLQAHHPGVVDAQLAAALVRNASVATGTVGALGGVLAAAETFTPPLWLAWPVQLVAETVAVVAVELKLLAELQEVYGRPVTGTATLARRHAGASLGTAPRRAPRRDHTGRLSLTADIDDHASPAQPTTAATPRAQQLDAATLPRRCRRRRRAQPQATRAIGEAVMADLTRGAPSAC